MEDAGEKGVRISSLLGRSVSYAEISQSNCLLYPGSAWGEQPWLVGHEPNMGL